MTWARHKTLYITALIILILFAGFGKSAFAANGKSSSLDQLLPLVGGALVQAGQGNWKDATGQIEQVDQIWQQADPKSTILSAKVNSTLAQAKKALAEADSYPDAVTPALSELVKAINNYVKDGQGSKNKLSGQEAARKLVPIFKQLLAHIDSQDGSAAKSDYRTADILWKKNEVAVSQDHPKVYGEIEINMSKIRIALGAEPLRAEEAVSATKALIELIDDYTQGKIEKEAENTDLSIANLIDILNQASADIDGGHITEAAGQMQSYIQIWPAVEGQVKIRSVDAYNTLEKQSTEVAGYLVSNPANTEKAKNVIQSMKSTLTPMVKDTKYTAWDAGLIILREGLEAILVLTALLAYLKRTNNEDKQKWIWSGVWIGLLLSGVMAFVLTYAISQVSSGNAREWIEGLTGIFAVVMMIAVGNWLHSKSNIKAWNNYIDQQMGSAIARGSLWSMFAVSCLAILREGAETTIFYIGMAPSIDPLQLVLGIVVTFAILIAFAYVMIRFSVKLPMRPFFLVASGLIYVLVFRFLGRSIHSLQVAAWVPVHSSPDLPTINLLGVYSTWETTLPQIAILVFILGRICWVRFKNKSVAKVATNS